MSVGGGGEQNCCGQMRDIVGSMGRSLITSDSLGGFSTTGDKCDEDCGPLMGQPRNRWAMDGSAIPRCRLAVRDRDKEARLESGECVPSLICHAPVGRQKKCQDRRRSRDYFSLHTDDAQWRVPWRAWFA